MTKRFSTALAVLLLAGASGAALAQDHERGQSQPQQQHAQPQQHAGPPPGGGGREGGGHPGGGPPHMEGGSRGPGPGERGPSSEAGGQFHDRGPQGPGGGPPRVSHEAGPGPGAPHQFDHQGGPRGPGGPGGPSGHANVSPGQFGGTRAAPQHWQAGRFPPVFQAQQRFHYGAYRSPPGYYYRSWGFGEFLPRPWFIHDYWMNNFLDFGLPYPPPGYTWVRVGPDALMIDRYTGRIVQVVRGIFW